MTINRLTETANLVDALESKWAGTKWSCENELYSALDWKDDNTVPKPTEEEINTEIARLQTEYDAQDYARNRQEEYPSIEECVHAILDDDLENLQILRQAVKEKFPKNE